MKLKERHDAAARDIAKELRWIPERGILDQWQEAHRRWCEHQESEGRLRFAVAWVLTVAHWGARWQNARRRLL